MNVRFYTAVTPVYIYIYMYIIERERKREERQRESARVSKCRYILENFKIDRLYKFKISFTKGKH